MDSYAKKIMLNWLKYDLRAVDEPLWHPQGVINFVLGQRPTASSLKMRGLLGRA